MSIMKEKSMMMRLPANDGEYMSSVCSQGRQR
jgi:hypothetical protein